MYQFRKGPGLVNREESDLVIINRAHGLRGITAAGVAARQL